MVWSGGSLAGTSSISGDLALSNTLALSSGTLSADGTVTINQTSTSSLSGGGTLDLNGALTKSGTGAYTISGVISNNNGSVSASGGTLAIGLPTSTTNSGSYAVSSGATLDYSATTTTIPGNITGAGTVDFSSGTITVTGDYNLTTGGTTIISGAAVDLSNATLLALGDSFSLSLGSLNIGSKTVSVLNSTWSDGTISGTGTFSVTNNLSLSGALLLDQATLQANSIVTIDITSDGTLSSSTNGIFTMGGTLTKSGTGNFVITGVTFNNTGTVKVTGGTLTIGLPSGPSNSGSYSVSLGATLSLSCSGTHTFGGTASFSDAGAVTFTSGAFAFNNGYSLSGLTTLNGTGVSVAISYPVATTTSGSFTVTDGALSFSGTHNFDSSATFGGLGTISFSNGTFSIAGNYSLTGSTSGTTVSTGSAVSFSGATLNIGNALNFSGNSLDIGNHTPQVNNAVWSNGTLSGTGGTLEITGSLSLSGTLGLNTSLTVDSSKTASIASSGSLTGSGTVNLNGTLTQTGTGTSFSISSVIFNNKGAVNLEGGTLAIPLLSGSSNHGTYAVSSGTQLYLAGAATTSSITSIGGASTGGAGTVEFVSGLLAVTTSYDLSGGVSGPAGATIIDSAATVNLGSANPLKPGNTLTLNGSLDIGNKSVTVTSLVWNNGTLSGSGSIAITTSLVLSGNLALDSVNLVPASNIAITLDGSGSLTGGGTFTLTGTLTKTSAGTFDLSNIVFDNQGTVTVNTGTLVVGLKSGSSALGTYNVLPGSFLSLAGSHTFNTGSAITGGGTVSFTAGAIVINSDYERAGETIINGATADVTINYPSPSQSSIGKFTVTQGSLTFNGDHTFSAGADISGGGTVDFGTGTINVSSSYNLSGTGSATTIGNASVNMSGITGVSLGDSLTITGGSLNLGSNSLSLANLTWNSGTITGTSPAAATVSNSMTLSGVMILNGYTLQTSGTPTVTLSGTGSLSGTGTFNMGSTLTKSGSGDFSIGITTFNNIGTVNVSAGNLIVTLPSETSTSGSYSVGTGAGLSLSGVHTFNFITGDAFSGLGTVTFTSGTFAINAGYSVSGLTTLNGSGLSVAIGYPASTTSNGSFAVTNGALAFSGTHTFNSSANFSGAGTIAFSNGTFSIAGDYDLTGSNSGTSIGLNGTLTFITNSATLNFGNSLNFAGTSLNIGNHSVPVSGVMWSSGTLSGTGGTLEITGNLSLSGTLVLNTTLTVDASKTVSIAADGALTGSGTINLNGSLTKTVAGTTFTINVTTFNNSGSVAVQGGTLNISLPGGSASAGTYSIDPGAILVFSGSYTFPTAATIGGAGTVTFASGAFTIHNNYGLTGETILGNGSPSVTIQYPSAATSTGKFTINTGSLTVNGDHTFDIGADFSGPGAVNFTGGTITINSAYGITGLSTLNGSALVVNMNYPSSLPSSLGAFMVTQGTLNISGIHTFATGANFSGAGTVNFTSGTIGVHSNYSLTGTTVVSGAAVDFSTATSFAPGTALQISGGSINLGSYRPMVNTITWSGGQITCTDTIIALLNLSLSGNLTLNSGILYSAGSASIDTPGTGTGGIVGTGTFRFPGTVTKTGTGTFTFGNQSYDNFGAVEIKAGTLAFSPQTSATSTGSTTVDSGATLELDGSHGFTVGSAINNFGSIVFNPGITGIIAFDGQLTSSDAGSSITVSSGTINIVANAILNGVVNSLAINGGVLDFSSGGSAAVGTLTLAGGGISGADNLSVTTALNWSNGWMSGATGAETTTVAPSTKLNFTGTDALILDSRQLVNRGDAVWNRGSGSSYLYLTNGSNFTNDTGATFAVQGAGDYVFWGSGVFYNKGSFSDSATATASIYGISFINTGTVNVTAGILEIGSYSGSSNNSGAYTVTSPGTLRFLGGPTATDVLTSSSSISGTGTVEFRSETVVVSGTYQVSGATIVSGAHVTFSSTVIFALQAVTAGLGSSLTISSGDLTLTSGKAIAVSTFNHQGGRLLGTDTVTVVHFNWSGGDIGKTGQTGGTINVTGTFSYTATAPTNLISWMISNQGAATWTGSGTAYFNNLATFDNTASGILTINSGTAYSIYGGSLSNEGTLNLTSGFIYTNTYTQATGGVTNQAISGGNAGTGYCQLQAGTATLAGDLDIDFGSYSPMANIVFTLMAYNVFPSKQFDHINIANGPSWQYEFNPNTLSLRNPNSMSYIYLPLVLH